MPRELLEIIKSYLRPIDAMTPVLLDDGYPLIPVQQTSVITEWLPIAHYDTSYYSTVLFVNCNLPAQRLEWSKKIYLLDLVRF